MQGALRESGRSSGVDKRVPKSIRIKRCVMDGWPAAQHLAVLH